MTSWPSLLSNYLVVQLSINLGTYLVLGSFSLETWFKLEKDKNDLMICLDVSFFAFLDGGVQEIGAAWMRSKEFFFGEM